MSHDRRLGQKNNLKLGKPAKNKEITEHWKSGNDDIYMTCGSSPYTVKLFSPEVSVDEPNIKPRYPRDELYSPGESTGMFDSAEPHKKGHPRRLSSDSDTSDTIDRTRNISVMRGRPQNNNNKVQIVREDKGGRRRPDERMGGGGGRRFISPPHADSGHVSRSNSARNTPTLKVLMTRPSHDGVSLSRSFSSSSSSSSSSTSSSSADGIPMPLHCGRSPRKEPVLLKVKSFKKDGRSLNRQSDPHEDSQCFHHHHQVFQPCAVSQRVCLECQRNLDEGNTLVRNPVAMSPVHSRVHHHSPCCGERTWKLQPVELDQVEQRRSRSQSRQRSKPKRSVSKTVVVARSISPRRCVSVCRCHSQMSHQPRYDVVVRSQTPVRAHSPRRACSPRKQSRYPEEQNEYGKSNQFVGRGEIYANRAFLKMCQVRGPNGNSIARY